MSESLLPPAQAPLRRWLAGEWLDNDALRPLGEINSRCVQLLRCQAQRVTGNRLNGLMSPELRALWGGLDEEACGRLANCPYSLVDVGFNDGERWQRVQQGAVQDLPRAPPAVCFDAGGAQVLLRQVLVYGWHLARAHRQLARIVFGMTPPVSQCVAALSLQELERIAEHHTHWLRPRWENRGETWRQLLLSALDPAHGALQQATLHGLQLMAGSALGRTGLAGTESRV